MAPPATASKLLPPGVPHGAHEKAPKKLTAIDAITQIATSQEKNVDKLLVALFPKPAPATPATAPLAAVAPPITTTTGAIARAIGMLSTINRVQKGTNPKWDEKVFQSLRRFALKSTSNAEILLTLAADMDTFIDDAMVVVAGAEAIKDTK